MTIGTPAAAAIARWHLVCAGRPSEPVRRCFSSLRHAVNWVEIDGAGRVQALVWGEGAWRTRRGVGLGSRIGAVKAAYGRALTVRTTPVWTYMSLRRTVGGQVRVTGFLGRTKVGDVVQMYVTRERRRLLSAAPATVPAGAGFAVVLTDWGPREIIDLDVRMPWDQGFGEDLGRVRVGRDGTARLSVGATGILASTLARRPPGTAGPVVARIVAGDRHANVALALPGPPALAVTPGTLPADGAATVTVTGAEPAGAYEVDAEWTCPATGATGRRQGSDRPAGRARGRNGDRHARRLRCHLRALRRVVRRAGAAGGAARDAGPVPAGLPAGVRRPASGSPRPPSRSPGRSDAGAGRRPGAGGMVPAMNIVISGGGMVGMTLAHLLRLRGFSPVVIERQREGEYMPRGYMLGFQGTSPSTRWGSSTRSANAGRPIAPRDGEQPVAVAVRFGALIEALARDLPVVYEHTVVNLIRDGDDRIVGVEVEGPDGRTTIDSDLVVACDGVMSPDPPMAGLTRRSTTWPTGRSRG